jgi:hypothetical protein
MRRGFEIFDSDTHLNPMVETLEPYFDPAMRQRMPATRLFHALTPVENRICTDRCRTAAESFATGHGSTVRYRHCRTGLAQR